MKTEDQQPTNNKINHYFIESHFKDTFLHILQILDAAFWYFPIVDNLDVTYSSGKKAKKFYQSCMTEGRQRRAVTIQDFHDLIKNLSQGNTFAVTLEKVHRFNHMAHIFNNGGPRWKEFW